MELYSHERLKGGPSLQFSFVTKMASTICNDFPIYDYEVAAMHGFRTPTHIKDAEKRLGHLMKFYRVMQDGYQAGLDAGIYQNMLNRFDQRFAGHVEMSAMKKLDFIVWSAGKILV